MTREPTPVGPGEIAAMVGLSRQRVDQLSRQVGFPEPWAELLTGRIWRDTDIEAWAATRTVTRGRPKKGAP
jgi:predicted DNA-binding transcriptional regulator AlpA